MAKRRTGYGRGNAAGAALVLAIALAAGPLAAKDDKPEKPVTDNSVSMGDAATTPITDLNLHKDPIPELLLQAREAPYDLEDIRRCSQIASAVGELDAVLGEDLDIAEREGHKLGPGGVAKMAVGSFIPFRGVIREVSGARKHEQEFRDAIVAGMMRRSFLKGVGLQKGCGYPARPATQEVLDMIAARDKAKAEVEAALKAEKDPNR